MALHHTAPVKSLLAALSVAVALAPFGAFASQLAPAEAALLQEADSAQVADLLSTGVGLAAGAAEANPLGLGLVGVKVLMREQAATAPALERPRIWRWQAAVGSGALANNVCITISLVAGAALPAVLCPLVGVAATHLKWSVLQDLETRALFDAHCREARKVNPALNCVWTNPAL